MLKILVAGDSKRGVGGGGGSVFIVKKLMGGVAV